MDNATTMRERQLNVRLSPDEGERFDAVATHYGLNPQGLIRMLIKREADALGLKAGKASKRGSKKGSGK